MKLKPDLLIVVASLIPGIAQGQAWSPQKNVEIVVPSVPGGTNDKIARSFERILVSKKLVSSSVSVVNKAGGASQLSFSYVGQYPADPHYLLVGTPSLITAPIVGTSKIGYNDFTPIALLFNDFIAFSVNPASPVKSGKDLVGKMKADAQSMPLGFATSLGNQHHICAGLFMKAIGAGPRELKPVVFKGSAEVLTAVLGGHIALASTGAGNAAPHVEAGKLRVVGVSSERRLGGALAAAPTWKEQGVNLVYGSWRAILAPKGLTGEQVKYWEGVLGKAVQDADWKAELERNFWSDQFETGATLRKSLDKEYADTKAVLTELGLAK